MRRPIARFPWIALFVGLAVWPRGVLADLQPAKLRCEYLENPAAVDVAAPRLSWIVVSGQRAQRQSAYQVLVAGSEERLAADEGDLWDSGKVVSDATSQVAYGGRPLADRQQCWWKVRVWDGDDQASSWSEAARWASGIRSRDGWQAQWIAAEHATEPKAAPCPATMLRTEFELPAAVKRATLYATGLGLYEMRINGVPIGDNLLAPEWTLYSKRLQYQTYDVTQLLAAGRNALGAQLAEGWSAGPLLFRPALADPVFRLLARLDVELADGTVETIVSDGSWRGTDEGPIRASGIYAGETYDARREMPGWDRPGFDDGAWKPVQTLDNVETPLLVAQPNEPIRVVEELKPVTLTEPTPGAYVFDLGQNMVGWCRVTLRGPAGTTVTMRHAERLNDDGTIYTANLREAAQTNRYTLHGGDASEVFEPHFTYQGFRYLELTGLPSPPAIDDVLGRVFCSDAPRTGWFECSNPLLNQLMRNIFWVQRANLESTPNDCPQRDERLGWLGDIQAFSQTSVFNMDMSAFFTKWVPDIRDSQADDGRFPDFAPHMANPNQQFSGAPSWGDAGVIVPWRVYVNYGDRRMLEEHFESARRWVDYVHRVNPDLLWVNSRGNDYGDWLNGDTLILDGYPKGISEMPKEAFATAFFAHSTELVARMAAVLGKQEDAAKYLQLAKDIKAAFRKAFVASDGRIKGDTQAGYALALRFDLLEPKTRSMATAHLIEAIGKYNGHPSTGIQTTHRMMLELSRGGCHDEAWRLVNLRTIPSWGFMIDHGATTIWERWDGYVPGRGFQGPGMNSFNHWAFGSVGEWIWRELVGLNPDAERPGYQHFVVRPGPAGDLNWVRGRYDSIRGPIEVDWKIADGRITLAVAVPANTTATVHVPTNDPTRVTESGQPCDTVEGLHQVETSELRSAVFEIGSGNYKFAAPYTPY